MRVHSFVALLGLVAACGASDPNDVEVPPVDAAHDGAHFGTVEVGALADLMVVSRQPADPYAAILAARPKDVRLTMIRDDGRRCAHPRWLRLRPTRPPGEVQLT